jgi:hypothetical protein
LHKEKAAIHDFVGLAKAAVITKHRGLQKLQLRKNDKQCQSQQPCG